MFNLNDFLLIINEGNVSLLCNRVIISLYCISYSKRDLMKHAARSQQSKDEIYRCGALATTQLSREVLSHTGSSISHRVKGFKLL